MSKRKKPFEPPELTISYKELGTISIEELRDSVVQDAHALRDNYHVRYVKDARLRLLVTNEYGEEYTLRRPLGGTIRYMDTHHHRPACKDYDL